MFHCAQLLQKESEQKGHNRSLFGDASIPSGAEEGGDSGGEKQKGMRKLPACQRTTAHSKKDMLPPWWQVWLPCTLRSLGGISRSNLLLIPLEVLEKPFVVIYRIGLHESALDISRKGLRRPQKVIVQSVLESIGSNSRPCPVHSALGVVIQPPQPELVSHSSSSFQISLSSAGAAVVRSAAAGLRNGGGSL